MPNRPPHSMKISPGYERDPLAPKEYQVLVETEPGKFTILGNTATPLELLQIEVGKDHAVGLKYHNMMIVEKGGKVQASFHHYKPEPQEEGEEISKANIETRDRWIDSIMKWLLPPSLWPITPENREEAQTCMKEAKVQLSIKPDGSQVVIFRDDAPLANWP